MLTKIAVPFNDEIIKRELYAMLAYRLGRKETEINGHLNLTKDLYIDSLDLMEIEIGVIEIFGIELLESELSSLQTVDDLQRIIAKALGA